MKIRKTLLGILVMALLITTTLVPSTNVQAGAKLGTTKVIVKNSDIGTDLKVTWKKVSKANGYDVYMSTSKNGKYKKVSTTGTNTYTTSGLKKNKTYYFKVKAYKTVNSKKSYGNYSKISSCKTSKYPLNTVIDKGGSEVYFYWLFDGTGWKDKNFNNTWNACITILKGRCPYVDGTHRNGYGSSKSSGGTGYFIDGKEIYLTTPRIDY